MNTLGYVENRLNRIYDPEYIPFSQFGPGSFWDGLVSKRLLKRKDTPSWRKQRFAEISMSLLWHAFIGTNILSRPNTDAALTFVWLDKVTGYWKERQDESIL